MSIVRSKVSLCPISRRFSLSLLRTFHHRIQSSVVVRSSQNCLFRCDDDSIIESESLDVRLQLILSVVFRTLSAYIRAKNDSELESIQETELIIIWDEGWHHNFRSESFRWVGIGCFSTDCGVCAAFCSFDNWTETNCYILTCSWWLYSSWRNIFWAFGCFWKASLSIKFVVIDVYVTSTSVEHDQNLDLCSLKEHICVRIVFSLAMNP